MKIQIFIQNNAQPPSSPGYGKGFGGEDEPAVCSAFPQAMRASKSQKAYRFKSRSSETIGFKLGYAPAFHYLCPRNKEKEEYGIPHHR